DVVEALDMLDVKGRIDIDTAGDQLFDIKVALWMTAAGCVRVCQFVDQHQLRPPLQDGVEIHLSEAMSLVIDLTPRNVLKPAEQSLGLAAPVRLDDADDHIEALAPLGLRRLQHLIGLADTRRGAEKDFQPSPAFLLSRIE